MKKLFTGNEAIFSISSNLSEIRGWAIFMVLVIHFFSGISQQGILGLDQIIIIVNGWIRLLFHGAVPLFVFLIGFQMANRCRNLKKHTVSYKYLRSPILASLKQYLLVIVCYLIIKLKITLASGLPLKAILIEFLVKTLTFTISGHLWFVGFFVCLYLIIPWIMTLLSRFRNHPLMLLIITLLLQAGYGLLVFQVVDPWLITIFKGYRTLYLFLLMCPLSHLFYFVSGVVFYNHLSNEGRMLPKSWIHKVCLLLVLIGLGSILYMNLGEKYGDGVYNFVTAPILPLFFSLFCIGLVTLSTLLSSNPGLIRNTFKRMGFYSFSIYLFHWLVMIHIIYRILSFFSIDYRYHFSGFFSSILMNATLIIGCALICLLVVNIGKRIPLIRNFL